MLLTGVAIAFVAAWLLTGLILLLARRLGLVDTPNQRSSHSVPTPTLGGGAILVATLAAVWCSGTEASAAVASASGVLLLLVLDDAGRPLGVAAKAGIQVMAAVVWVVMAHLAPIQLPWGIAIDGWPLALLAIGWMVAWMNVFNFMDGIDGISCTQTIAAGVGLCVVLAVLAPGLLALPLCLVAAAAGFLIYNLPPARIFMGDVGSAFLGLCFGVITLQAMAAGVSVFLVVLPLGYYLYDTSLTILRRAWRGENVLRAHREHLYQRLVQRGHSHTQVCLAVLAVDALLGASAFAFTIRAFEGAVLLGLLAFAGLVAGSVITWQMQDSPHA